MRAWLRFAFIVIALLAGALPAAAGMQITYADWAKETPHERELVIAALLEGLTGIPHNDTLGGWTKHFAKCVADNKMTDADLVTGIDGMVAENPTYSSGMLLMGLTHFLELKCGKPDGDSAM
jgi:hypothetical protein